MKNWFRSLLLCLAMLAPLTPLATAQAIDVYDQRTHDLYNEIRCPVCSGQSIAESDVLVSVSIREYVQARIEAGDSDDVIKQNLTERYGQNILFEPTLAPSTLPLWLAPWIALMLLIGGLWYQTGRSRAEIK
ncbi:MAG: cytochrome c-type biogenesis protein [Hyphomonadaceae bacterium]